MTYCMDRTETHLSEIKCILDELGNPNYGKFRAQIFYKFWLVYLNIWLCNEYYKLISFFGSLLFLHLFLHFHNLRLNTITLSFFCTCLFSLSFWTASTFFLNKENLHFSRNEFNTFINILFSFLNGLVGQNVSNHLIYLGRGFQYIHFLL